MIQKCGLLGLENEEFGFCDKGCSFGVVSEKDIGKIEP